MRRCAEQPGAIEQVAQLIAATLAIDLDELERLVQQAHECTPDQEEPPEQRFPVSRQALRMFWRFRIYLDSIDEPVRTDREAPV